MKELKLPFGLKDGILVDVLSVSQGLECGCSCPACGARLVAKKGATKIHHFAHYKAKECQGAVETALHLMAKDIIQENKKLFIPPVHIVFDRHKQTLAYAAQELIIDSVELEKREDDIVPDLVCVAKGTKFYIEIAVTHYIDEQKLKKLQHGGVSTIEVDLGKLDRLLSKEALGEILLSNNDCKSWVYNAKAELLKNEVRALAKRKQEYSKGLHPRIRYCPRNNRTYYPDADLMGDCIYCNHFVGGIEELLCTGEAKDALLGLAKRYGIVNGGAGLIEAKTLYEEQQGYNRKQSMG